MLMIQQNDLRRKMAMTALSKSRTSAWTDNLNDMEVSHYTSGAARNASLEKRHLFEGGNWGGKLLENEGRYFDQIYPRNYQPDQINKLEYERSGGAKLLK